MHFIARAYYQDKAVVYYTQVGSMTTVVPEVPQLQGLLPPDTGSPHPALCSCIQIPESLLVLPPGVSLGVFSLRERHNATYNEHMPMNELHTAICNQLAHGKLHVNRPPRQGPNAAHPFRLPATLDVGTDTKWGLEPQILR